MRSCPLLRLLKGIARRYSAEAANFWEPTHSQEAIKPNLSRSGTRDSHVVYAAPYYSLERCLTLSVISIHQQ